MEKFFEEAADRLWKSYRSTLLGLLVAAATELIGYFASTNNAAPPWIHALAGVVLVPFLAWKDKAVRDGTVKLLVFVLLLSGAVQAQNASARERNSAAQLAGASTAPDPTPSPPAPAPVSGPFSGCVGRVCFGPTVALTVTAINLSTKKVEGAFSPGLGVGLTVNPGVWSAFGLDAYFSADVGAQNANVTLLAKMLNGYLRIGVSKGLIGDTSWRIPLGLGVDL